MTLCSLNPVFFSRSRISIQLKGWNVVVIFKFKPKWIWPFFWKFNFYVQILYHKVCGKILKEKITWCDKKSDIFYITSNLSIINNLRKRMSEWIGIIVIGGNMCSLIIGEILVAVVPGIIRAKLSKTVVLGSPRKILGKNASIAIFACQRFF